MVPGTTLVLKKILIAGTECIQKILNTGPAQIPFLIFFLRFLEDFVLVPKSQSEKVVLFGFSTGIKGEFRIFEEP